MYVLFVTSGQSDTRTAKTAQDRLWLDQSKASQSVDILQWRRIAQSFVQGVKASLARGRGHPKVRASGFLRGPVQDAPSELVEALQASSKCYAEAVMHLDSLSDTLGTTVMSQLLDRTSKLLGAADAAQACLASLDAAVEAFATWKSGTVAARNATKKRTVVKLIQFIRPYEQGGVPPHLARVMVTTGMVPRPVGAPAGVGWPEYVDSSFAVVTASNVHEVSLGKEDTWKAPLCFDLRGSLPKGAECPKVGSSVLFLMEDTHE